MSTQSGSRLPAWCAGLEDSMERMALSLDREVTGWTGPDTVFVPEDYGYIPGEKATAALRRAVEAAARHGGVVRRVYGHVAETREVRVYVGDALARVLARDQRGYLGARMPQQQVDDAQAAVARGADHLCF